jgi:uncharacterized membrane protein YuzA (DUF378 family)
MKTITFPDGVLVALLTGLVGTVTFYGVSSVFGDNIAIRFIISGLTLVYILYLLRKSNERIGRVLIVTAWTVITFISWAIWIPPVLFVLTNLAMIWLTRSLYFYSSLFSSLADLGLTALSVVIALWAATHSNNLFLTIWCFFLTQALFVMIPSSIKTSKKPTVILNKEADFQHAYRVAESAIRKLSINQ